MSKFFKKLSEKRPNIDRIKNIPDAEFYKPLFSPWLGYKEFKSIYSRIQPYTVVSNDRCWYLYVLAQQAVGLNAEFWECGVFKGGTALLFSEIIRMELSNPPVNLRLFDTFEGMPQTEIKKDLHAKGDFSDTSLEKVSQLFINENYVEIHKGLIPETFKNLEQKSIGFAHIDVDIYKSTLDACSFIYPRLVQGGIIVIDDYGFPSCPGARMAIDEYFSDSKIFPLSLSSGQAIIFKSFLD